MKAGVDLGNLTAEICVVWGIVIGHNALIRNIGIVLVSLVTGGGCAMLMQAADVLAQ